MEVEGNTVVGSYQEGSGGGSALFILGAGMGSFVRNNVFAASLGSEAIRLDSGQLSTSCNVFWNNELGEAVGFSLDPTDLIADPLFCDPASGVYTVSSASLCLPENNPNCVDLIGAYGPGCGFVSIEPMSWGRLKGIYRTGE
jgi:hypothetical protein